MITKEIVQKHLQSFKEEAIVQIFGSNYTEGIKYIELFARLSNHYNLKYTDDLAEELIAKISKAVLSEKTVRNKKNKIIFYDSFATDNRGLTQQYLRALFSWNCEVLFVTNTNIGADIFAELIAYPKSKILIYNKKNIDDYKRVVKEITEFNPEKAFLHFSPWDISGFCIWNAIKSVDRFLINLTDHAFWLGKYCADYILEFRRYGSYLSVYERNISINKLLLQPYYPIFSRNKFQGFPFKENTLIALAGSTLYKIAGREDIFLRLMKEVLLQNKGLTFVLAGAGKNTHIKRFIDENGLDKRFYLIGERKDIASVIEKIDIFVNTYPMIGALMSQYAAVCKKPIIGYTSPDLYGYNDVEDLLQIPQTGKLVKKEKLEFITYFHQLVENILCREENVQITKECVSSAEEFSLRLHKNVYDYKYKVDQESIANVKYDSHAICELYLDMENSYQRIHYDIIVGVLKLKVLLWFPFNGLKCIINKLVKRTTRFIHAKLLIIDKK